MESTCQDEIDSTNKLFWNQLCGTVLAKELGIEDSSPASLEKFDTYYMNYYPYLESYLQLQHLKDKKVLEVGLGYGTISQRLALAAADYHGLDIATNPVEMVQHRLNHFGIKGDLRVGSMLQCPFPDNYFDYVIAIGCFHHTGNMRACVNETHRVLKKGGTAVIMVYNKFSLRQWNNWPLTTLKNLLYSWTGKQEEHPSAAQRRAYDASTAKEAAPETQFFSKRDIRTIFQSYNDVQVTRENFDDHMKIKLLKFPLYAFRGRLECLDTKLVDYLGLDLYIQATK